MGDDNRSARAQARLALRALEGGRHPGGCEFCDAFQTVEEVEPGVWVIGTYHDDWCPRLAGQGRAA